MDNMTTNLRRQIKNCQDLLSVFQDERKMYQEERGLGMDAVMAIMQQKLKLVDAFDQQQKVVMEIKSAQESVGQTPEELRQLVRELAELLEQLLVIDQENERLLRDAMNTASRPIRRVRKTRQRPALQRQLPLVPPKSPIAERSDNPTPNAVPSIRTPRVTRNRGLLSQFV